MRIEFLVDLDAEISRIRARNHVFSDFWCSIEFSSLVTLIILLKYSCTLPWVKISQSSVVLKTGKPKKTVIFLQGRGHVSVFLPRTSNQRLMAFKKADFKNPEPHIRHQDYKTVHYFVLFLATGRLMLRDGQWS